MGGSFPTQIFIVGDAEHGQTDTDDTVFYAEQRGSSREGGDPLPWGRSPQRDGSLRRVSTRGSASNSLRGPELCLERGPQPRALRWPSQLWDGHALAKFRVTATGTAAHRFSEPALHFDN